MGFIDEILISCHGIRCYRIEHAVFEILEISINAECHEMVQTAATDYMSQIN